MVAESAHAEQHEKNSIEVLYEQRLSWGRVAIKEGQYGKFFEVSRPVNKQGEEPRYDRFRLDNRQLSDAISVQKALAKFIEIVESD